MSDRITEADWKVFKEIHPIAMEHYAHGSVAAIKRMLAVPNKTNHERFWDVFNLVTERRKDLTRLFADYRRSTAAMQVLMMRSQGLVTDKEMARFSDEIQKRAQMHTEWRREIEAEDANDQESGQSPAGG